MTSRCVDFIIIGAQKCATTTLADHLSSHPEITMARIKEPHYFSEFGSVVNTVEEYHELFDGGAGPVWGEASTHYTALPMCAGTARRIQEYNSDIRLIYVLRDPVDRAVSNYIHNRSRGRCRTSVHDALRYNPLYIERSRYMSQLRPYLFWFPPEQILVLLFEDVVINMPDALHRIADHVGVAPEGFSTGPILSNPSVGSPVTTVSATRVSRIPVVRQSLRFAPKSLRGWIKNRYFTTVPIAKPTLSSDDEELLWACLHDEVQQLQVLLGRDLHEWATWNSINRKYSISCGPEQTARWDRGVSKGPT